MKKKALIKTITEVGIAVIGFVGIIGLFIIVLYLLFVAAIFGPFIIIDICGLSDVFANCPIMIIYFIEVFIILIVYAIHERYKQNLQEIKEENK